MAEQPRTIEEIWGDDLFDRRAEAGLLIGYLESVAARGSLREDSHGFTLAVDARYGEGKSFFLKRLAEQLSIAHPVAFVDAWTDDLADEPLTALAATLKRALDTLIAASPAVRSKYKNVIAKSGQIAKIVGGGLVKRALGLAITATAADALEGAIRVLDDEVGEVVKEKLKTAGDEIVGDGTSALSSVAPGKLMETRIAEFELGQDAIKEMRESLEALVASLNDQDKVPPIFIIIDELDRCRPTYAVKLLEEIKHLFNVPGLIFILGLHGDQLAHSVTAAYGTGFDGKSYLRRFFHRQYRLAAPDLKPLLQHLCDRAGIADAAVTVLPMVTDREPAKVPLIPETIALYMTAYGLSARNAFEVVDILQTCFALVNGNPLCLNYLLPLIIGHVKSLPAGELPKLERKIPWRLFQTTDDYGNNGAEIAADDCAMVFQTLCNQKKEDLRRQANANNAGLIVRAVNETIPSHDQGERLWSVANYPKLLATVGRFRTPEESEV